MNEIDTSALRKACYEFAADLANVLDGKVNLPDRLMTCLFCPRDELVSAAHYLLSYTNPAKNPDFCANLPGLLKIAELSKYC